MLNLSADENTIFDISFHMDCSKWFGLRDNSIKLQEVA